MSLPCPLWTLGQALRDGARAIASTWRAAGGTRGQVLRAGWWKFGWACGDRRCATVLVGLLACGGRLKERRDRRCARAGGNSDGRAGTGAARRCSWGLLACGGRLKERGDRRCVRALRCYDLLELLSRGDSRISVTGPLLIKLTCMSA